MATVLKTENLRKQYHKYPVIDNLNLEISAGDIYGLIGENGAGKTTIINLISGVIHPTSGRIFLFEGDNLEKARAHISCLMDTPILDPTLTAAQNIIYYCLAWGIKDKKTSLKLLDLVNLSQTGRKKVKDFSFGMKQRLALAISLINAPDFIIMDEPTNGLDPVGIKEFRELILRLNREKGITFLISSHILGELSEFCTKYGIIKNGKLINEFSNESLMDKTGKEVVLTIDMDNIERACNILRDNYQTENINIQTDSNRLIVSGGTIDSSKINSALVKNDIAVYSLQYKASKLEDIFLNTINTEQSVKTAKEETVIVPISEDNTPNNSENMATSDSETESKTENLNQQEVGK